jgi:hypothetical protein
VTRRCDLDALNVNAIRAQPALGGAHARAGYGVAAIQVYRGAAACALDRAEPRRGPALGGVRAEHAGAVRDRAGERR